MDLNAVKLFVAAAQAGSLSKAARQTRVPLPTVSRRLRRLEDELGVRLFERGARGLSLTSEGTRLLAEAAPAVSLLDQAEELLRDPTGVSGTLRVSLPPHFEPMWSVLEKFADGSSAVRIDVFVTDRRIDLVADGVDVAIRVGAAGHAGYIGRTIAKYRHKLVASPSYLEEVAVTTPEDLRQLNCAMWRTEVVPVWELGDTKLLVEPAVTTNDYRHLLQLAVRGRVVTEVPPFLAHDPLRNGQLVEVLPDYPLPTRSVRALVADTRLLSPLIRHFLDFAAEVLPTELDASPRS